MRSIIIAVILIIILVGVVFFITLFLPGIYSFIDYVKSRAQKRHIKMHSKWRNVDYDSGSPDVDEALSAVLELSDKKSSMTNWDDYLHVSDEDLLCAIDKLADCYIHGLDDTRDKIRTTCASQAPHMGGILLRYATFSAIKLDKGLRKKENTVILNRGLAAVSIENLNSDYRDSLFVIRKLQKHALKIGIDPGAFLFEIMEISSDVSPHPQIAGYPSMRTFLSDMHSPNPG